MLKACCNTGKIQHSPPPPLPSTLNSGKNGQKKHCCEKGSRRAAKNIIYNMLWPMPSDAGRTLWGGFTKGMLFRAHRTQLCTCSLWVQKKAIRHTVCQGAFQITYPLKCPHKGTAVNIAPFKFLLKKCSASYIEASVSLSKGERLTVINSLETSKRNAPSRSISIHYCKPGLALQTMIQIRLMITSQTYELSKCQHNLSYFNKPVQPWPWDSLQPATP